MRAVAVVAFIALCITLPGCAEEARQRETGDAGTPDTGVDGGATDLPAADGAARARFCGTVVDPDSQPVQGVDIIVCDEHTCHSDIADDAGGFCVAVDAPGSYLFHAVELRAGDTHLGDVLFPLSLGAEAIAGRQTIELGSIVLPRMGAARALDPAAGGTLDLGGGASLVVPSGVTSLPPLVTEANVALGQLDVADLHANLLGSYGGSGTLVRAFVIVPVGVTFSAPVSFTLPGGGLASGTALVLHWVNSATGKPESHATATVTSGGAIVADSGQGLRALGWFLLYAE